MSKLLFIPGLMCDERLFAHQASALSGMIDIAFADVSGPASITGMANRLLDRHAGELCVAGLSMGGIIAMEMAKQAPDRIQRLALLDTNHHADPSERFDIRNRQIADVYAGRLVEVIDTEMVPTYFAKANQGDPSLSKLVIDMATTLGAAAFERQSLALRDRPDQSETLRGYHGPALVLCGEEDRLCPPSRHREMAALLDDARLEIVEGAGHLSTIERPDVVTAALRRWLFQSRHFRSNNGETL